MPPLFLFTYSTAHRRTSASRIPYLYTSTKKFIKTLYILTIDFFPIMVYTIYAIKKKREEIKMRIVKNIEEPTVNFEDIEIGGVFLDQDENVCMRVPNIFNEFSARETEELLKGCMNINDFYKHGANAYDLGRNEFFWFEDNDKVRPLKAYMEVN